MERERLEKLEKSVADLIGFIQFMLVAVLIIEILALSAIFVAVYKIGEFWMVDSRNIYYRIETLEKNR